MQNADFMSNLSKMIKYCHFSVAQTVISYFHFTSNVCNSLLHDNAPMPRLQTSFIRPSLSFHEDRCFSLSKESTQHLSQQKMINQNGIVKLFPCLEPYLLTN